MSAAGGRRQTEAFLRTLSGPTVVPWPAAANDAMNRGVDLVVVGLTNETEPAGIAPGRLH